MHYQNKIIILHDSKAIILHNSENPLKKLNQNSMQACKKNRILFNVTAFILKSLSTVICCVSFKPSTINRVV